MSLLKFYRKSDVDYVIAIQQDGYGNAVKALRDYCYGYFMGVFLRESGLSKYDAEDYFQDAFVTLWTQISTKNIVEKNGRLYRWKFDKSTYQTSLFSFDRDIRSYLVNIGLNNFRSDMRRKHEYEIEDLPLSVEPREVFEGYDKYELENMVVADALQTLPRGCRTLLRLFFYEQLSNEEVLARTDGRYADAVSLKTGKSKCMKKLKETSMKLLSNFNY